MRKTPKIVYSDVPSPYNKDAGKILWILAFLCLALIFSCIMIFIH